MGVHAQSRVAVNCPWIQTFDPALWTALTDKEESTYNTYPAKLVEWKAEFDRLCSSLNGWKGASRSTFGSIPLTQHISNVYSYLILNRQFGEDNTYEPTMYADQVFDFGLGTFVNNTVNVRPVTWYDDMPVLAPFESPKITADKAAIDALAALEAGRVSTIQTQVLAVTQPFAFKMLFNNPPPGTPMSKKNMWDLMFTTMKYKMVFDYLNTAPVTMPPDPGP